MVRGSIGVSLVSMVTLVMQLSTPCRTARHARHVWCMACPRHPAGHRSVTAPHCTVHMPRTAYMPALRSARHTNQQPVSITEHVSSDNAWHTQHFRCTANAAPAYPPSVCLHEHISRAHPLSSMVQDYKSIAIEMLERHSELKALDGTQSIVVPLDKLRVPHVHWTL